jgi:CarboxypepD_reg-like domain
MKMHLVLLIICFALVGLTAHAHNNPLRVIKGVVVDGASGETLTGVRVTLPNGLVAITDEMGCFQMAIQPELEGQLRFELVSFQSKCMSIQANDELVNVQLFELP